MPVEYFGGCVDTESVGSDYALPTRKSVGAAQPTDLAEPQPGGGATGAGGGATVQEQAKLKGF